MATPLRDDQGTGWTLSSVLIASASSLLSLVAFTVLALRGMWPAIPWSHQLISVIVGAVVLWRRHPESGWLVGLVYSPVAIFLVLVATAQIAARAGDGL